MLVSGGLQSVDYLDKKTGSWCVTTDMPEALSLHIALKCKNYILCFGKVFSAIQFKGKFLPLTL